MVLYHNQEPQSSILLLMDCGAPRGASQLTNHARVKLGRESQKRLAVFRWPSEDLAAT